MTDPKPQVSVGRGLKEKPPDEPTTSVVHRMYRIEIQVDDTGTHVLEIWKNGDNLKNHWPQERVERLEKVLSK